MRKEMDCPTRTALDCQFCPQLRLIGIHPVLEPFTLTRSTSPAPATFVMSTRLNDGDDAGTVLGDLEEHGHGEGLPLWHHRGSSAHLISKQDPQLSPSLKRAVLSAAVSTPYEEGKVRRGTHGAGGVAAAVEGGVGALPGPPEYTPGMRAWAEAIKVASRAATAKCLRWPIFPTSGGM
ncbi:unnamed protein product [Spirodela intermedia]|uniref:Uncharacterized protein n=1 Tax=Spirodela intermedia TaxID=51605 RepID=A0A7I8ID73_SPIIN|nr:unnamed protein product [Spirodela intermedia]CAA6654992.1 unnamed protein product [Spirodela intermedia]